MAPDLSLDWERTRKSDWAKRSLLPLWAALGKPLCSVGLQAIHTQNGLIINNMIVILTNIDTH